MSKTKPQVNLNGNILLAAGCIAYTGPFTSNFRQTLVRRSLILTQSDRDNRESPLVEQISQWVAACHKHAIPVDSAFSLEAILGQPAEIRKWNIQVCLNFIPRLLSQPALLQIITRFYQSIYFFFTPHILFFLSCFSRFMSFCCFSCLLPHS